MDMELLMKRNGNKEGTIMKSMNNIIALTTLLVAGATFFACSNDENEAPEQSVNPSQNTYTLTVIASKNNDAATRALSLSGSTLNATWSEGDEVKVYNSDTEIGTLTAQNSGASTTLTGNLTLAPSVGDNLTLKFLSPDYAVQEGTLEYIAANCDYATATVTVSTVNTTQKTITTTGNADFHNQQAIVKLTLTDASSSPISISKLTISYDGYGYAVTPATATNEFYVAIPYTNYTTSKTISLYATDRSNTYIYSKSSVFFDNGQFYSITVKMRPPSAPDGVQAVDLGLPSGTLWANMNVGATNPEECGDYFAWAETEPQDGNQYNWESHKYVKSGINIYTKYCNNTDFGYNGFIDNKVVLEAEDDAATVNWGNQWRMPTIADFRELIDNTNLEIINNYMNGAIGCKFSNKNDESKFIYLPSAGSRSMGELCNYSSDAMSGQYWSSSLIDEDNLCNTWCLYVRGWGISLSPASRISGFSIRPVRSSN